MELSVAQNLVRRRRGHARLTYTREERHDAEAAYSSSHVAAQTYLTCDGFYSARKINGG